MVQCLGMYSACVHICTTVQLILVYICHVIAIYLSGSDCMQVYGDMYIPIHFTWSGTHGYTANSDAMLAHIANANKCMQTDDHQNTHSRYILQR